MRILSTLPSATEIVYALGLGDSLVGVSHECDYPPEAAEKLKVIESAIPPGTDSRHIDELVREFVRRGEHLYRIRLPELKRADPDLIITQELCDVCAIGAEDVFGAIRHLGKPVDVISLNPHTLRDVQEDIRTVGKATDRLDRAERLIEESQAKLDAVRKLTAGARRRRVFCAEWLNPLMNAGHWVPEMVQHAGGVEGLANRGHPSTYIEWENVLQFDPEVIVLMPCGFTTEKAVSEARFLLEMKNAASISAVRQGRVYATDGHDYFSRSGPRLFDGVRILAQLVHPELFTEPIDPRFAAKVEVAKPYL